MQSELLRFDKSKTLVFIDCETLNLCLSHHHNLPWQVAMLKTVGGNIVDSRDFLIKWDTNLKISEDARRITRYPEHLIQTTGKKFSDVFGTIRDWLDSADCIVGHNVLGFDIYLIKDLYKKQGLSYKHLPGKFIDTYCLAKGIKFGVQKMPNESLLEYQYKLLHTNRKGVKTSLITLGKEYSIEHNYENLHDALTDLELNLKVWNKLKYQVEI